MSEAERSDGVIGERIIVGIVLIYRATVGQFLGGYCRFEPSCSQYTLDAVRKHGAAKGGWRGFKRICRCRPGGGRGYDPA